MASLTNGPDMGGMFCSILQSASDLVLMVLCNQSFEKIELLYVVKDVMHMS